MQNVKVRDLMPFGDLVTVHEDTPIGQLDKILDTHGVSGVPVVDSAGKLVGEVSQSDIVRLIATALSPGDGFYDDAIRYQVRVAQLAEDLQSKPVSEIMARKVQSISPNSDIQAAAEAMIRQRHHRLPVLDNGRLIGIVTSFDLLKAIAYPFTRI
jgi:CBS domain-containing protein